MPKAASEDDVRRIVMGAVEHMTKDAAAYAPARETWAQP
jgi:hypothetical protein